MEEKKQIHLNLSAPNLINLCIDGRQDGEFQGRLYHCFQKEAIKFENVVEMIREMEKLFDKISFPQASTQTRSFFKNHESCIRELNRPEKIVSQQEVADNRGELGTYITTVGFRQKSTWQGTVFCVEKESTRSFSCILDLIRLIDIDTAKTEI